MQSSGHLAILTALAVVLAVVPLAASQDEAPALTFTGDEGPACPVGKLTCFTIEGDLTTAFVAGQEITIKVAAAGDAPHNLYVTRDGEQDANGVDTNESKAFARSETVESGKDALFTFTIPADATKLYYWCDVGLPVVAIGGDHEFGGMRGKVDVNPAPEEETGENNSTTGDSNQTADPDDTTDPYDPSDGSTGSADEGADDNNTTADPADASGDEEDKLLPMGPWVAFAAVGIAAVIARRRR